jgi:hypothetical protein
MREHQPALTSVLVEITSQAQEPIRLSWFGRAILAIQNKKLLRIWEELEELL